MKNLVYFLLICIISVQIGYTQDAPKPEKERSVIGALFDFIKPDLYETKITLSNGEVITLENKVASTKRNLERRFTLKVLDHTLWVVPKGETEARAIKSKDIEKIEIVRVRDKPLTKDIEIVPPVPAPEVK